MKKFLVGYDGTEPSREAGLVAARLTKRLRAMVTVLTVGQPAGGGMTAMAPHVDESAFLSIAEEGAEIVRAHGVIVEAREEMAVEALSKAIKVCRNAGVKCDVVRAVGKPADVICRLAQDGSYDLVVVGRHRRSGVARLVLGSVSDEVLRKISLLVLLASERTIDQPRHFAML